MEISPPFDRHTWAHQGETLYWTPLKMLYTGLDGSADYVLRFVPGVRFDPTLQLYFDGTAVGDPIETNRRNMTVQEVAVPRTATADGTLEVMWEKLEGRGPHVAEVWLIKQQSPAFSETTAGQSRLCCHLGRGWSRPGRPRWTIPQGSEKSGPCSCLRGVVDSVARVRRLQGHNIPRVSPERAVAPALNTGNWHDLRGQARIAQV